jgi:23S rRNA (adenine2030-N6)-methyltransferase
MNYRHAFHAGNFADVVKHAVLARVIAYLQRKDKAFRVIDTHAGAGLYGLASDAAARTGEWRSGIGRVMTSALPADAATLLSPYLDAVRAANPGGGLSAYPGSPAIVRHLLRRQDRLTAIEKHPDEAAALKAHFAGDIQTRVIELDGWLALGGHLPPKERRGLVLVDPPFEAEGEFDRLVDGLVKAHRRWPGGLALLWYPIKDRAAVAQFRTRLAAAGVQRVLDIRFPVRRPSTEPRLDGSGLIAVNPPFTLEAELAVLLPALATVLAEPGAPTPETVWLAREPAAEG